MREFFQGWRRKAGVVALVVACVLAVLWGRTILVADVVQAGPVGFGSVRGGMFWYGFHPNEPWRWETIPDEDIESSDRNKSLAEILHDEFAAESAGGEVYGYVLYWWLILPLTALSAYLILWPQRKPPKSEATDDDLTAQRQELEHAQILPSGKS